MKVSFSGAYLEKKTQKDDFEKCLTLIAIKCDQCIIPVNEVIIR